MLIVFICLISYAVKVARVNFHEKAVTGSVLNLTITCILDQILSFKDLYTSRNFNEIILNHGVYFSFLLLFCFLNIFVII